MSEPVKVAILGAPGSIGQALAQGLAELNSLVVVDLPNKPVTKIWENSPRFKTRVKKKKPARGGGRP